MPGMCTSGMLAGGDQPVITHSINAWHSCSVSCFLFTCGRVLANFMVVWRVEEMRF